MRNIQPQVVQEQGGKGSPLQAIPSALGFVASGFNPIGAQIGGTLGGLIPGMEKSSQYGQMLSGLGGNLQGQNIMGGAGGNMRQSLPWNNYAVPTQQQPQNQVNPWGNLPRF